jgi:alkylation response protein AidB-like acyl-CoA dehydrogenase
VPHDDDLSLTDRISALVETWRSQRAERQARRHLERADFDALAEVGFLRAAVPADQGGTWQSVERSTRDIAEALRVVARVDSSVALVAAMHPAVLGYWLSSPDPAQPAWEAQARGAYESAASGSQWGTITSEPGSGGDIMRTRTRAVPGSRDATDGDAAAIPGARYALTGDKHFGSGYGISHYMFTTALVDGEDTPAAFFLDMRRDRDGADGITVTAEWDGAGMTATQSHAARLEGIHATRLAWSGELTTLSLSAAPMITALFTAVVLGVLDAAVAFAREQLGPKRDGLRAYEQVEWARADLDHWIAVQCYEAALDVLESGDRTAALFAGVRAKTAVAEASERALTSIARVVGGGSFSRRSPIAGWYEDVRALGFLRPPWGLAYDTLFATSFDR